MLERRLTFRRIFLPPVPHDGHDLLVVDDVAQAVSAEVCDGPVDKLRDVLDADGSAGRGAVGDEVVKERDEVAGACAYVEYA